MTVLRRTRFVRLCIASLAGVVLAIWQGGVFFWLAFAVVATTVGYAVILRRLKIQRDEARSVVRELHLRPPDLQVIAGGNAASVGAGQADGWSSTTVRLRRWEG